MFNFLENSCSFFEHFLTHPGGIAVIVLSAFGGLSGLLDFTERLIFPFFKKNKTLDKAIIKICKDYLEESEEKNEKNEKTPKNGV